MAYMQMEWSIVNFKKKKKHFFSIFWTVRAPSLTVFFTEISTAAENNPMVLTLCGPSGSDQSHRSIGCNPWMGNRAWTGPGLNRARRPGKPGRADLKITRAGPGRPEKNSPRAGPGWPKNHPGQIRAEWAENCLRKCLRFTCIHYFLSEFAWLKW